MDLETNPTSQPDSESENDDALTYLRGAREQRAVRAARDQAHRPRLTRIADRERQRFRAAAEFNLVPSGFQPTFRGKQFEENWLLESLGGFYDDSLISDILSQVKGGKEANVYCCLAHPSLGPRWVAGKVFRPRMFRNLKNDAAYRTGGELRGADGKALRKKREQRAVADRTTVGLRMLHQSWLANEAGALGRLQQAGTLTPRLYGVNANALLMDFHGEPGDPAPTLNHITLGKAEARRLYDTVLEQIRIMLRCEIIHGDLSAFNILYYRGEIRIIDFPQSMNPWRNPRAFTFFRRDVTRVLEYFERYADMPEPGWLARALWREAYGEDAPETLGGERPA